MSYTVYLTDPTHNIILPAKTPNYTHGTMVALDPATMENLPNTRCELTITANYTQLYKSTFGTKGIDILNGMTGQKAAPTLVDAIIQLGSEPSDDYWARDPGNAGAALRILLNFALDHPDGVFSIGLNPEYPPD